jgi:hypothetical protein
MMRITRPLKYSILRSFSKPMATPCRTFTEQPRPDPTTKTIRKKKRKEKRDHKAYLPYIQGIADCIFRLMKKKGIHNIQKRLNKMASRLNPPRTVISRLKNHVFTR